MHQISERHDGHKKQTGKENNTTARLSSLKSAALLDAVLALDCFFALIDIRANGRPALGYVVTHLPGKQSWDSAMNGVGLDRKYQHSGGEIIQSKQCTRKFLNSVVKYLSRSAISVSFRSK